MYLKTRWLKLKLWIHVGWKFEFGRLQLECAGVKVGECGSFVVGVEGRVEVEDVDSC